ncbi:MAG: ribonuclease J [Deltaproteobacteria bacterium]|nr:ribonuclease J [Deltaproteobacteria bacterium]
MSWAEPSPKADELKITPLGGLGEIGLNMMVLECRNRLLVIDAGVMFPDEEMLGVDLVIPDASFLSGQADKIEAVVVTHGHEDHIGALPFLLPGLGHPPVYGSAFSLALVQEKLKEHSIEASLRPVEPGQTIELGPFEVEFITVAHSIPEGFGLKIGTPLGTIVHSGDFKVDHSLPLKEATDLNSFAQAGQEGTLLLMADSTNVEREGYTLSEELVSRAIESVFRQTEGKILVASFASNIRRIKQVIDLAARFGRRVAFSGKSLVTNVRIAKQLKLLDIPEGQEATLAEVKNLPPDQVCILSTGSQGEPLAALTRIALGEHKQVQVEEGDVVILSSRFIPGHERAITHVINHLYRRGAEVLYEHVSPIHSSGHAYQDELRLLMSLVKPRYYLPIHGEVRHLVRNAILGQQMGIPRKRVLRIENGDQVVIDRTGLRVSGRVDTGRIFVDGKGVGDVGEVVLRDRRYLSAEGVVFVLVVVDHRSGEVISGPEVVSRGFVFEEEQLDLLEEAKDMVAQVIEDMPEPDWGLAQDEMRRTLRRFFNKTLDRRPMILPMVLPM